MPFRAKRLRVQIPCGAESVMAGDCCFSTAVGCGTIFKTSATCDAGGGSCLEMIEPLPERFFVDSDCLPLLRKMLEMRLEQSEMVSKILEPHLEQSEMVTAHVRTQLKEIEIAEHALGEYKQKEG